MLSHEKKITRKGSNITHPRKGALTKDPPEEPPGQSSRNESGYIWNAAPEKYHKPNQNINNFDYDKSGAIKETTRYAGSSRTVHN